MINILQSQRFPFSTGFRLSDFYSGRKLLNVILLKIVLKNINIPTVRIPAIKKGEDFITAEGSIIKNEVLTTPPATPLSFAYCSDTKYFKRLASFVEDVTVLYHEATFDKELDKLAKITGHSTTINAAQTALNARAGSLIIGHFSSRYREYFTSC